MKRPIPLLLEVEPAGFHRGWDVSLNGIAMYHRPYDGSDAEQAADEFLAILGTLMRRETGYSPRSPEGDDDA